MDRFGLDIEQRVDTVAGMAGRGCADRRCSRTARRATSTGYGQTRSPDSPRPDTTATCSATCGPRCARGVTEDQIETLLVASPRRYLSGPSGA
jgi:hypothetical protein